MKHLPSDAQSIGYRWFVDRYKLVVIPHFRWSYLIKQGARTILENCEPNIYLYDQGYKLENLDDPFQHLVFALKHEGLNLEIIKAFWNCVSIEAVRAHVASHPTGKYQRIIWYLYEKMTTNILEIPDLKTGPYVKILDAKLYYTAQSKIHRRYRIHDNLLGNFAFCPFVRKTNTLKVFEQKHLDLMVRDLLKKHDSFVLDRASTYLYAHETMSSYQIEREIPSKQRLARFIELVKKIKKIPKITEDVLVTLQHAIVDKRFINHTYRSSQNYVGENRSWYQQVIHYICPKPEDVNFLMENLLQSLELMIESNVHSIVIAAAISFGFVFIHPFDDGNGRLHRFLIHYILHRTGFTPPGMIFPVSAVILSDMSGYDTALEKFSGPLMKAIKDYDLDDQGVMVVHQQTAALYQFIDYTVQAEYLATCIEKTINTDFKKELNFLTSYDKTKEALRAIVDMPDKLLDLFIMLTYQHDGKLSQNKRTNHFKMLTDQEINQMEEVVQRIMIRL